MHCRLRPRRPLYDGLRQVHKRMYQASVQPPTSADNVALPAFARRTPCCSARAAAAPGGRRDRSISTARRALSSKPTPAVRVGRTGRRDAETDGRTPNSCIDSAPHAGGDNKNVVGPYLKEQVSRINSCISALTNGVHVLVEVFARFHLPLADPLRRHRCLYCSSLQNTAWSELRLVHCTN